MKSFTPEGLVRALLGPTNTGKTHRAIQRMLQHPTGMIGLPLRLLAREVYDRISAEKGEESVALVTGEERRIPPTARWWVCTVEAMPLDRQVSFLAVDEIQLAGDRNRGHVFTDRLLHARGVRETMFLGSETIAPVMERLVPHANIERFPRLSKLSHLGYRKLGALPRRSAIVAFSANEVYALAEAARQRHGGAAVVMGALSPRTRNAQVAMFQSGEVPVIVATDAIGMGLNMDVAHVAFSSLRKFDGADHRGLSGAEVAQIAGRAGRHTRDGTFGPTHELDALPPDILLQVEAHAFPPLRRLWWRNRDLDTDSIEGLRASLLAPPPSPLLQPARDEDDALALEGLLALPEVRAAATSPERVALLWATCQVPDFRKTLPEVHARLLATVYLALLERGRLSREWVLRQLAHHDRVDGDIDRLASRLAHVRTWTYLGHRDPWIEDAPEVQRAAREVEDRLSDALHEALTARFVDRRGMVLAAASTGVVRSDGEVRVGGYLVGHLRGIGWKPANETDRPAERAALRALSGEVEDRVQRLVDAPVDAFSLDADGGLAWEGGVFARLVAGADVLSPGIRLVRNDLLGPAAVQRVERKARALSRDLVRRALGPLASPEAEALHGPVQGLVYALSLGMGCIPAVRPTDFGRGARGELARLGVRFGALHTYVLPLVEDGPVTGAPSSDHPRGVLWRLVHGLGDVTGWARACGRPTAEGVFVRADALEGVAAKLREVARKGPFRDEDLGSDTGMAEAELRTVLHELGCIRVGETWVWRRARR